MSTPTNERSETCERDEDLEKLIGDCFMSRCFASENGCDVIDYENFVNACNAVAAFSARRAREKAIEECVAAIRAPTKQQMAAVNEDQNEFRRGFYTALCEVQGSVSHLKTK